MSRTFAARGWGWLAVALFAAVTLTASPASAATAYGTYTNYTTKKIEGNYTWVDCGGCADDQSVTVSNYKNGYHVRVQLQIDVYANDATSTPTWTATPTTATPASGRPPQELRTGKHGCASATTT